MDITIEVLIKDAEDGELLHKIVAHSIDSAIEGLGSYERNQMKEGKVIDF